jgi:NAD(P) transhydrogenase subunit alpha
MSGSRRAAGTLPVFFAAMRVRVPREPGPGEHRVALTPETVGKLRATGFEIVVERGAGVLAGFPDDVYADTGSELVDPSESLADVEGVVRVGPPSPEDVQAMREGLVLIGFLQPLTDEEGIARLRERGVVAFAMESIPRITRAQSMDALSSQATVAGYKSVLLAADRSPKLFPMMMTAAGTIAPARVLVLGAGVAGLQAIATARRLGAVVSAFDVRPAVAEQVASLGATFLDLGVTGEETEGGYARELTPEQQAEQQKALEARIPDFDAVITTAAIPGRPAPRLIPAGAVESMRPGSVIVDLAADTGGNCELTSPGREIAHAGVTIVGLTNVPSLMPQDASRLYARNVAALLEHLAPAGALELDFADEITSGACVAGQPTEAAA